MGDITNLDMRKEGAKEQAPVHQGSGSCEAVETQAAISQAVSAERQRVFNLAVQLVTAHLKDAADKGEIGGYTGRGLTMAVLSDLQKGVQGE